MERRDTFSKNLVMKIPKEGINFSPVVIYDGTTRGLIIPNDSHLTHPGPFLSI